MLHWFPPPHLFLVRWVFSAFYGNTVELPVSILVLASHFWYSLSLDFPPHPFYFHHTHPTLFPPCSPALIVSYTQQLSFSLKFLPILKQCLGEWVAPSVKMEPTHKSLHAPWVWNKEWESRPCQPWSLLRCCAGDKLLLAVLHVCKSLPLQSHPFMAVDLKQDCCWDDLSW